MVRIRLEVYNRAAAPSYIVNAEIDTLGTGLQNASNPSGHSSTVTITTASLTDVNITVPGPVTPTGLNVAPGSNMAVVQYDAPLDANDEEIATAYKVIRRETSPPLRHPVSLRITSGSMATEIPTTST